MSNQIKGVLKQIYPTQSIDGKNGILQKREFVITTDGKYPKDVCFTTLKDKTQLIDKYAEGEHVLVSFSPESREYNGRWYTSLNAYQISSEGQPNANDGLLSFEIIEL